MTDLKSAAAAVKAVVASPAFCVKPSNSGQPFFFQLPQYKFNFPRKANAAGFEARPSAAALFGNLATA